MVVVGGVGAALLPVPPVSAAYHKRLLPVAVNGVAVAFWQSATGLVTVGGGVTVLTATFVLAVAVVLQAVTVTV